MEVTIITNEVYYRGKLVGREEKKFYPRDIQEFRDCVRGHVADKIKINIEYTVNDIPELISFLHDSRPCFGQAKDY